jgi:hypothetical protein
MNPLEKPSPRYRQGALDAKQGKERQPRQQKGVKTFLARRENDAQVVPKKIPLHPTAQGKRSCSA